MSKQDLAHTMQEMMTQMAQMRAELDSLKARAQVLPQPAHQTKSQVTTTRCRILRRMAGGLLAGLAISGIGASLPQEAAAKFVSAKGWGAIVVPPGGTITGNTPAGTVYGLYATSDTTTDISAYLANYKIGVIGLNTSTAGGSTYYGVYGQAKDAGVYGKTISRDGAGVYGISTGDANGVVAISNGQTGFGVYITCFGEYGITVY